KTKKRTQAKESLEVKEEKMQMTRMLLQEPGWKLERKGSALFLRRDSSHPKATRVCFRCDVEVREYERDEDYGIDMEQPEVTASPLAMCASCLAALCVTVILPWLLIGG
ncbi:GSCOCG00005828001-RA-CDS, partial [Cotesia congregata]